jgi:sugar phosphate isomerase/epimerase
MIRYSYIVMERLGTLSEVEIQSKLATLQRCGYAGVELNLTEPAGVDLDRLSDWVSELGLTVPSFLTGEAYFDGLCLSSADSKVRSETVARLTRCLNTAKKFDAILVVGLLQGLRSDEPSAGIANQRIVEGLARVAHAAEDMGCEIVIEPVNHLQVGFNNSVQEVLRLIAQVGSAAVRPMVDTIHMNIEEHSLPGAIRMCGSRLRHVHLCENNGGRFGAGHIDFRTVMDTLREIGYDGFASVKVYRGEGFEQDARSSLRHLFECSDDADPRDGAAKGERRDRQPSSERH